MTSFLVDQAHFVSYILRKHRLLIGVLILNAILVVIVRQNYPRYLEMFYFFGKSHQKQESLPPLPVKMNSTKSILYNAVNYAVFASNTPNGESYRSYDYVFNLPLTVLAWGRIGFKSIVLIIGFRCEWENDPTLGLILSHLEEQRANVIFVNASQRYRPMLSQTARLFAMNMKEFPGKANDYLITTDSDLWPLRREHYVPRRNYDIVLLHSDCCGEFTEKDKTYTMYPMSNIGASVSVWQQIINDNHKIAYNEETIVNYFEEVFGELARSNVRVGEEAWYMDQWLVSIRLTEWMAAHGNNTVFLVSDEGFFRVDRPNWKGHELQSLTQHYDAHVIRKSFLPARWKLVQPLINLMFGNDSSEAKWCQNYHAQFLGKVANFLKFTELDY